MLGVEYSVDMFTSYQIRRKRKICIEVDPYYAKRKLVEDFNQFFGLKFTANENEDYIYAMIDNQYATNLEASPLGHRDIWEKGLIPVGEYSLKDSQNVEIFRNAYKKSVEIIRKRVIILTGATISEYDSFLLTL